MWRFRILDDFEEIIVPNQFLRVICWLIVLLLTLGYCTHLQVNAQVPSEASKYRRDYTRVMHSEWGMDAPIASLAAQLHQESGWNCGAMSRVGAQGCAQFMPATATWLGQVDPDLKGGDVFSPAWAFRAQAVYMRWLREKVKAAAPCDRMAFALSAYNGGLGYVYRRQKLSPDPWHCFDRTCDINPGILEANQRENARYPRRVLLELEPIYLRAGWGIGSCS